MKGQVIRVISGFYDILSNEKEYRVRGSGNLRKNEDNPMVGDFVEFEKNKMLTKIYDRKNSLNRPKVSNVDQVVIVMSLVEPDFSSKLLNKFLAVVEFNNIHPIIIFTKKDKTKNTYIDEYNKLNYDVFELNSLDKNELKEISYIFKDKLTVFMGQTGVGKSTTIANLSNTKRDTQEISKSLGRGKHTTRVVEIIPWNKGRLIDTPGFSSFDLDLSQNEFAKSYYQFRKLSKFCKYKNCLHFHEKICAVKEAYKNKEISESRYNDYISLLKEINYGR